MVPNATTCGGHWLPPFSGASGSPAAGYPADYTNCTADPAHSANCLAVHKVHTTHEARVGKT